MEGERSAVRVLAENRPRSFDKMTSSKLAFVEILRRLPLFTDVSEAELSLIAESVSRLHFDEGAIIFAEGDACSELLIVEVECALVRQEIFQQFRIGCRTGLNEQALARE